MPRRMELLSCMGGGLTLINWLNLLIANLRFSTGYITRPSVCKSHRERHRVM